MARRLFQVAVGLVVVLLVLVIGAFAWIIWFPDTLKPPLERLLSAQLGRDVQIRGPLRIHPGLVTTVELEGLRVAAPDWAREPDLAALDRLRLGVDVGAYLRQRVVRVTELVLDRPRVALERDAQGRTSWPTGQPSTSRDNQPGAPPQLDAIQVTDGHVGYLDAIGEVDAGVDVATEQTTDGRLGLLLKGAGSVTGDPLELAVEVDSAMPLLRPDQPLRIDGTLHVADTQVHLGGRLGDPAAAQMLDIGLDITSANPRNLLATAGRTVEQDLPPLALAARLTREAGPFVLQIDRASWGNSSLEGQLQYDPNAPRPNLRGEIRAPVVDAIQLAPAFAGSGEPAPPQPTNGNPLSRLAGYAADLHLYVGEARLPPQLVLHDAEAGIRLADGRLSVAPLHIGFPEGTLAGEVTSGPLTAIPATADVRLEAKAIGLAGIVGSGYGGRIDATLAGTLAGDSLGALLAESRLRLDGQGQDLQIPAADLGSLQASATLDQGRLRLEPFRAVLPQGEVGGRIEAGPFDETFTADLDLEAKGVDLGAAARIDKVAGRLDGHLTGTLRGATGEELLTKSQLVLKGAIAGLRLPTLERRLSQATLDVTLDPGRSEALLVHATAAAGDRPLELKAFGGSVATIARNRGDYPFTIETQLGNNNVKVNGTVSLPLSERKFSAMVRAEGPDPSPILALFELPKLQIPPYRVSGVLTNAGDELEVKNLDGRVGDSDVAADLAMSFGGERPKITGDIRSHRLDADDLGGLVGAQPGTGPGETASPGQQAEAAGKAQKNEVLPTERLDTSRWRRIDADLSLRADEINAGKVPLDGFTGRLTMMDGSLRLEPLDLRVGDGHVTGKIAADGRNSPVRADVDLQLQRLSVARLLNRLDVDVGALGTLSGQARGGVGVGGQGLSIKEILANADGNIELAMEGGQINRTIVAGLGLDLLRLFGSFIGATPDTVALNCTLANLDVRNGLMTTRPLIVDTEIAQLGGEGTVDLKSEAIDISLTAQPKKTPLPTDLTGISIVGTLAKPELQVNPLALAARGAAAATLGVLLKPFTTFAQAIDPDKPASCADLLQQVGAPALPTAGGNG